MTDGGVICTRSACASSSWMLDLGGSTSLICTFSTVTDQLFKRKTSRIVIISIIAVMLRYETSSDSSSSLRRKPKIRRFPSRRSIVCMHLFRRHAGRERHVGEEQLSLGVL